jgi:hypothetical protein
VFTTFYASWYPNRPIQYLAAPQGVKIGLISIEMGETAETIVLPCGIPVKNHCSIFTLMQMGIVAKTRFNGKQSAN